MRYQVHAEDHPHACGDKLCILNRSHFGEGSSPRVWGQEQEQLQDTFSEGIIPTRVGTSYFLYCFILGL